MQLVNTKPLRVKEEIPKKMLNIDR